MFKKIKKIVKNNFDKDFVEFIKHAKNYVSADLLTKGLGFLSIPIFTRLLIPEEYGIISVFTSFVAIFSIIAGLGVRGSVTRYYYEEDKDFEDFYGSIILFLLSWNIIFCLFIIILKDYTQRFLNIPILLIYIGIGVIFSNAIVKILLAYYRAAQKSKQVAKIKIFRSIIYLGLSIVITIVLKNNRYLGKPIGRLIASIIIVSYALYIILKKSKISINWKHIKYSLVFGIPIIFHLIAGYVLNSFDKIIINQLIGAKETGLYSFAYKIGMIQNVIAMGALKSWNPIFYDRMNKKKYKDIQKLASKYSKLVYLLAVGLILFAKEIIILMADKKYHSSLKVVPIVVIGYVFLFLYSMYTNYSFYKKKTHLIALFTIIAGGINIGLNYLLIPKYGYAAAAWTTLVSYMCLFIFHYINVKYILKFKSIIKLKSLIPNFFKMILLVLLFYFINLYLSNYWIVLIIKFVLIITTAFVLFYKKLNEIIFNKER